jgi:hypothetical protein
MSQNKIHITSQNSAEWLASCGFMFPTTETELERFDQLYGNLDSSIIGDTVDPFRIIRNTVSIVTERSSEVFLYDQFEQYKLVATRLNKLPSHILDRLKDEDKSKRKRRDIEP